MPQNNTPQTNYYDTGTIELRYMEIGIALTSIDRMNPGSIPFIIPALLPRENKTDVTDKKIVQNSKSNIVTENVGAVEVSNIEVSNAIYITIPKELTGLPGAIYDFEGTMTYDGDNGSIDINRSSHMEGYGVVDPVAGYINVRGQTDGPIVDYHFIHGNIKGTATFTLNDVNRYIKKNSKWLIAFIGGDTSMPQVVCRLPDDAGHEEYAFVAKG